MLVVLDSSLILRVVVSNYCADEYSDRRLGHADAFRKCIRIEQSFYVALLNAQQ